MVTYHSSGAIRKLVRYIEKYYPEALLIIRPKDTLGNRERGYKSGQPDILLVERKCRYMGLAIWVTSEMSKSKTRFLRRLSGQSYETIVSEDFDDLRLCFDMYMAKCDDSCIVDDYQLEVIKSSIADKVKKEKYSPRTDGNATCIISCGSVLHKLVRHVRDRYPSAVTIPGLGVDGQADLMIISPNIIHNGLAIWISDRRHCYSFYELGGSYNFSKLGNNQLAFLKRMALRSYVTIATVSCYSIIRVINNYMRCDYEYGYCLPSHVGYPSQ